MKYIFLDIDGTLIEGGLWSCLIEQLLEDGTGNPDLLRGVLDDLATPGRSGMHAIRKGIPDALRDVSLEDYWGAADRAWKRVRPMPFLLDLARTLRRSGVSTLLVSGAPQILAEKVGKLFAADGVYACTITPGSGFRRIVDSPETKAIVTRQAMRRHGAVRSQTMAVGNGGNDIGMLNQVHLPVAFEPSPKLRHRADLSGWPIVDRNGLMAYLHNVVGLR